MIDKQFKASGGCYTCRFVLAENKVAEAAGLFQTSGREVTRCGRYLVVEFSDGFDALFIPIVPCGKQTDPSEDVTCIIEDYMQLDKRRMSVLSGLRRHAVLSGVAIKERADSDWHIQTECSTSGIHVGPIITRLVSMHDSATALVNLLEKSWLPKITIDQARMLVELSLSDPQPDPVPWKIEVEGILGSGVLSLNCEALESDEDLPLDPEALINRLAPTRNAPGQQAVNRLVQRLGRWRFSVELDGNGQAQLQFSDKLDQFTIHPRSKKLARDIMRDGLETTVDRIAAHFSRLDHARTRTICLLSTVMSKAGFVVNDEGGCSWFGKTHRISKFNNGRPLTLALHHQIPEQVVYSWLAETRVIPDVPSVSELAMLAEDGLDVISRRWLPSEPPENWDSLPKLEELAPSDLDCKAQDSIAIALKEALVEPGVSRIAETHDLLSLWMKPFWYRPGDVWASEPFWKEYAQKAWQGSRRDLAAVVLKAYGDLPGDIDMAGRCQHYDEWCSEAFESELLWLFVDELPWPIDTDEYPMFSRRLSRPPQIARRAARTLKAFMRELRNAEKASDRWDCLEQALRECAKLDMESAQCWMRPEEIDEIERWVRIWAAESDFVGGDLDSAYEVAGEFGWSWLPDVLAGNPLFVPAQSHLKSLYWAPGEIALRLSWIAPCQLAARFAACALADQSPELLEERARNVAGGPDFYESGRSIVRNWLAIDRFAAGIAWQRCRAAHVV